MKPINLHPPFFNKKNTIKNLNSCIKSGWVATSGKYIDKFEKQITKFTGSKYAVGTNSGTAALHLAIKILGAKKDDEIIVPTLTFVATINCVIYNYCNPIFMDCDEFYNIDLNKVLDFLKNETFFNGRFTINKKTKKRISILIITHVWGNAANVRIVKSFCKKKNIKIIEDASESLGTRYQDNKHTGTIGDIGVFSFNANKIVTTGGGGMIITDNVNYAKLAKYYASQAKDNNIYFIHNNVGFNYRMTNISAALGVSQMKDLYIRLKKKKIIFEFYKKNLNNKYFSIMEPPSYAKSNFWLNVVKLKKLNFNILNKYISIFLKKKIFVRPVWKLNHLQKPFKNYQNYKIKKSIELTKKSICLPSYPHLSKSEQQRVLKILNKDINDL